MKLPKNFLTNAPTYILAGMYLLKQCFQSISTLHKPSDSVAPEQRPEFYAPNLASNNLRYLIMDYDNPWRQSRKIAHTFLNVQASKKYMLYQDLESRQLLDDLLNQPEHFVEHTRRFATSLSAIMIFGVRYPHYDTFEVKDLYKVSWAAYSVRNIYTNSLLYK